jgi:hypothetical protein
MKIDLTKDGFDSIFTPWQCKIIDILCEGGEYTSATLIESLNKRLSNGGMSRTSVILFMDELQAEGITTVTEGRKQGGKYKTYSLKYTKESLWEYVKMRVGSWMRQGDKTI